MNNGEDSQVVTFKLGFESQERAIEQPIASPVASISTPEMYRFISVFEIWTWLPTVLFSRLYFPSNPIR